MNNFFINITKDLELDKDNSSNANTLEDVQKVINAHPSVESIRRNNEINEKFIFQQVTEDLVQKIIFNIDNFKATPVGGIAADKLKCSVDIHPSLTKIISLFFENIFFR